MSENKGWERPKCGRCYAPDVKSCEYCSLNHALAVTAAVIVVVTVIMFIMFLTIHIYQPSFMDNSVMELAET